MGRHSHRFPYLADGLLKDLYQNSIKSLVSSSISNKLNLIKAAEQSCLFAITQGTFLSNLELDLGSYGASNEDILSIKDNLSNLFINDSIDDITPNGRNLFLKYLNDVLEYICAKVYVFFKMINRGDYLSKVTPGEEGFNYTNDNQIIFVQDATF